MDEAEWLTRKKRIDTKLRSLSPQWQIIYYRDGFDFASRRDTCNSTRLAKARGQVDALTPSLPPSPGYGGTGLARAWTHSPPARSGCDLSLREILCTRSNLRPTRPPRPQ
jgi:hypothetical protein